VEQLKTDVKLLHDLVQDEIQRLSNTDQSAELLRSLSNLDRDVLKLQVKIDEHPNANNAILAEFESQIQNLKNQLETALEKANTPK